LAVVSKRFVLLVLGTILFWPVLSDRFMLAGASELDSVTIGLSPSDAPALLGAIASAGRKDWGCLPERAASAVRRSEAELPSPQ
jgi:hypothetical protein